MSNFVNQQVIYFPKEAVARAVKKFETPFFIYEAMRLRENCQRFLKAFQKYFPGFQPLYAVKANNNPDILKIVMNEGFWFDCSSESEAWIVEKIGGKGMYTGNYTPAETLKFAKKSGLILNLDDISNVESLNEIGVPDTVSFRINPGIGKGAMESVVTAGPDAKFGVPFEKAADAYRAARAAGIKKFGIHMMT
ncbi:MAG: diaminopimelate decarboxylase, partial [Patescibacteria group bacterium]